MLNFTHRERLVFYFLAGSLGVGAVLVQIRNAHLQDDLKPVRFYKEADSFKTVSKRINTATRAELDGMIADRLAKDSLNTPAPVRRINVNTASVKELTALPGIGPALAGRIKAFTDQHGPFKHKEDLTRVKGIGEKLYSRIQGLVTTE